MNPRFDQVEKAFYSDGYRLGMQAIESAEDTAAFFDSVAEMYAIVDLMINSLENFAQSHNREIACRKGCGWCCHQPVFAMDYELNYLNNFISKNFGEGKREEIRKRALEKREKLKGTEGEKLLNSKHPCPLLENDACLAYPARPMACRIYLSTNLKSCLNFYHHPEDKTTYPALLDFPMKAGRLMNEGFKAALKTRGIISKEFRIEEKL